MEIQECNLSGLKEWAKFKSKVKQVDKTEQSIDINLNALTIRIFFSN